MQILEPLIQWYTYLYQLPSLVLWPALLLLPAIWLYRWLTAPVVQTHFPHLFDRKSETFNKDRCKTFPPAYPNGWFLVASKGELKNGKIKSVTAFGQHIVIFLGEDGQPGVLDAHCPHQGAHLGGGKVVDGCIQCPFHSWEFGCDGKVKKIPYHTGSVLPDYKTRSWPVQVIGHDLIFVWHHVDKEPPSWKLEEKPLWNAPGSSMYYWGNTTSYFDMHVLEMAENSPDFYHFSTLHKNLPGFSMWNFLSLRFTEFNMYFDAKDHHIHYFDNYAALYLFDLIPLPTGRYFAHLTFEGPGVVCFNLSTVFGTIQLYKNVLPIGHFQTYCEDRIYADNTVPRWFCKLYSIFASSALEQDRPVWESKIFREPPLLVKGDGPWPAHRKWWNQFYSENSKKFREGIDW